MSFDSFMDNYFGYMMFGGIALMYVRHRRKSKARAKTMAAAAAVAPDIESRRTSDGEMDRLGRTKEARTARIEEIFNRKTETLSMDVKGDAYFNGIWLKGTVERPLAAMPPRERESLRAAYHLYNIGELNPAQFHLARLALLYGEGKAAAQLSFPINLNTNIGNDANTNVRSYTGMTAESAVSTVLKWLAESSARRPNDPTIRLLNQRLIGGGDAALSATSDFMAEQNLKWPALIFGISAEDSNPVIYTGGRAVITVAPPGSGKTQCHVFPTLLTWKGPAVVLDVKGEIYSATSKWRKENVGPVYRFAPLDPEHSASWNPLTTVRSSPDLIFEDSRFLADMMLVPSGSKESFWDNRARDVLVAAIARTCLHPDPGKRSIGDVLDVFHGICWDKFIMSLQATTDIRSMERAGHSLKDMEPKTRDGVLQTGLSSLSAWDGDRIERATRKSDWSPRDLRNRTSPPTIYMCLKPDEIDSYISVLRVFIAQHIRSLMSEIPPDDDRPVLFMLDEMPRLQKMPPIISAIDLGRQYKVLPWLFAQSLGQLDESYDKLAEGMVGTCAVQMYMNPSLHDGTAQKLSEQIGMQEGVLDNSRQKIVEATTLAGPEYKNYVIAMASGFQPFRVRKNFAYADPVIRSRMGSL